MTSKTPIPALRMPLFFLLLALTPVQGYGQPNVWINVEYGTALFLDPVGLDWVPITGKAQVVEQTFLMTRPEARAVLFKTTDAYPLPPGAYLYLSDVPHKNAVEVVGALTRIEADQLPARRPDDGAPRTVGLTYGKPNEVPAGPGDIPYEAERVKAIVWFSERGRPDAALLSLKRMMTRYPSSYLNIDYVELLLHLYDQLGLYGFMLDEAERLLEAESTSVYEQAVLRWHTLASKKLLHQP